MPVVTLAMWLSSRMDVLRPRTLDDALRLRAAHPEARPIQGGTDVMVELTFGHSRPDALLDLSELAELRGFSEEDGVLRLGAGLTYTEAMEEPWPPACRRSPRRRAPSARRRSATAGRSVATSAPGRPRGTRCLRSSPSAPRSSSRASAASGHCRSRGFCSASSGRRSRPTSSWPRSACARAAARRPSPRSARETRW